MRRLKVLLVLAIVCAVFCADAYAFNINVREIKFPTFGQPAFVKPGDEIKVITTVPQAGVAERALINSIDDGSNVARVGLGVKLAQGSNSFVVKTPLSIAPGLYDLCIDFKYGDFTDQDCQPHAVSVVKSFDPPFTFGHISDFHIGDPRAMRQFPGVDIDRVRTKSITVMNERKPAFVLVTGDINAYPVSYDEDYPASADKLMSLPRVPFIVVPGNHDFYASAVPEGEIKRDGTMYWPDFFGPRHRVLDYGPFRFICFDSYNWNEVPRIYTNEYHLANNTAKSHNGTLSRDEYKWVVGAMKTAGDRVLVLVSHHGPRQFEPIPQQWCKDCVGMSKFLRLINKAGVAYYFYGHIHENTEYEENGTKYISTTSVGSNCDKEQLWGVRMAHVNVNRKIDTEIIRLFDSPPMK
ncbi:MAG TPA: metallophosphoesterase [bacterium]|nr:metallophosphoesterase [bacterium]